MKVLLRPALWIAVLVGPAIAMASDHADPMSLNAFWPQDQPLANITDLHAFVVDGDGMPLLKAEELSRVRQLIVSLCVRRRLPFAQVNDPALEQGLHELSFRLHLDFDSEVAHYETNKLRDGLDYAAALTQLDERIAKAQAAYDSAVKSEDKKVIEDAKSALDNALGDRDRTIIGHQFDARMEALYGGTVLAPHAIAEEAQLDFRLRLVRQGDYLSVQVDKVVIDGISSDRVNRIASGRVRAEDTSPEPAPTSGDRGWRGDSINVQAGIFDDPFVFPRFFRGNVVGVVASIPLERLRLSDGSPAANRTILLWATTHDKRQQVDHVGRSLRTQLPRFGYLNTLHPSQHVQAILRRHSHPNLLENSLATFLAPLEAHRFYDAAPDVMIYDLTRPAAFPNGRWLDDDVAKPLADAGETLLFELSLTESRQFPRASTNDKPFKRTFPYLADPWSKQETEAYKHASAPRGEFVVPDAPDTGATALPDFSLEVWTSIWWSLVIGLLVTGGLAFLLSHSLTARLLILIVTLVGLYELTPIRAEALKSDQPGFMRQPYDRLNRALWGSGLAAAFGLLAIYSIGVRRGMAQSRRSSRTLTDSTWRARPRTIGSMPALPIRKLWTVFSKTPITVPTPGELPTRCFPCTQSRSVSLPKDCGFARDRIPFATPRGAQSPATPTCARVRTAAVFLACYIHMACAWPVNGASRAKPTTRVILVPARSACSSPGIPAMSGCGAGRAPCRSLASCFRLSFRSRRFAPPISSPNRLWAASVPKASSTCRFETRPTFAPFPVLRDCFACRFR